MIHTLHSVARRTRLRRKHIYYGAALVFVLLLASIQLGKISPYSATSSVRYYRARVVAVRLVATDTEQIIQARLLDGPKRNQSVAVTRPNAVGDASYKRLPVGSDILLTTDASAGSQYAYYDRWHLPGVSTLFFVLLLLVIAIGAWRGITSAFGLALSIVVLFIFVIPRIVAGDAAFAVCVEGAVMITLLSMYIAHGFRARTSVAFASSLVTLGAVVGLVALGTYLTGTSELITEDSTALLYSTHAINQAGLVTGGMVIASLGVLFDITTGQAAAVDEVYGANRKLSTMELYRTGLSVGREHIAALINTLALVYVGIALPAIVLLGVYSHAPILIDFNNETIIEEIVRTFVASMGVLLAVPISTLLAAYFLPRWQGGWRQLVKRRLRQTVRGL